jgi:hypothetical protein
MYSTVNEITSPTNLKPKTYGFETDEELTDFITGLILQAANIIDDYCNTKFTDPIPPTINLVSNMLVKNILDNYNASKNQAIIKSHDYSTNTYYDRYLTRELKELLKPYTEEYERYKDSEIGFSIVTGDWTDETYSDY